MPRWSDSAILSSLVALAAASCVEVPRQRAEPADARRADGHGPNERAANDHVAAYRQAFEARAGTTFVARASAADLDRLLPAARVLWLGDNHHSTRLHVLQRALLERLAAHGPPLALVLEAIGDGDEPHVADYLARRTDATTLRARLRARWAGSWLDDDELDAAHYRALLALAREHALPVHALEPTPRLPLPQRDAAIVARVRDLAERHPGRLLVVVVGQAHLLGSGDVVPRSGLPAVVVGGEPTPSLLAAELPPASPAGRPGARPDADPAPDPAPAPDVDELLASDGGLLWFAALLGR